MSKKHLIAVYYFPNYHHDRQNELVHGAGWNEWELVKRAEPRFPGHRQPRIPLWGYEDEANPSVMAKKIDAAAEHGIDSLLFDWYWYEHGPYLEGGLEQGFLMAPNNQRVKFAIHWANHDWIDIHPASYYSCTHNDHRVLYPGIISSQAFKNLVEHVIQKYFKHPSYWLIDGAPYFSIYDLSSLLQSFGGIQGAAEALAYFRSQTRAASFPDLHLNQVLWNSAVLPGEKAIENPGKILEQLGYSSFTSYVWTHHVPLDTFPETEFQFVCQKYMEYWRKITQEISLPYFPNASVGWDSSPRTLQSDSFSNVGYPFTPCIANNTPKHFAQALQELKNEMDCRNTRILTINSWNEWTEGSYLEPDTVNGMGYLEAIRDVFGIHHN
jgi:hypothetical protein